MNITKDNIDKFKALLYVLYKYNLKEKTASMLSIAIANYLEDYCNFRCIFNKEDKAMTLVKGKHKLDMQIVDNDGHSPSWYIYPSNVPLTNTSIILYLFDKKIIKI